MIGKTILHYTILEKLGEGGMGIVYLAEDTRLERYVALKFLPRHIAANPEERQRFAIEAKAAAALNHAAIAQVYAIEEAAGEMFIVMEYIDGKTIEQLTGRAPMPVDQAVDVAIQVARGLEAAHKKEIVHRDIKSANIMLTADSQAKIMDFGVARIRGGSKVTKAGTRVGTAAYMSPEQAMGAEVDQRSDIWSFGVVLYEMLSGRLPFESEYEQVMLLSIMNDPPAPIEREAVPVFLERIVEKMLAKDPAARYQCMEDLIADLRQVEDAGRSAGSAATSRAAARQAVDSGRPVRPTEKAPAAASRPLKTAGIVTAAAAVLLLMVIAWRHTSPAGPAAPAVAGPGDKSIAVMYFDNRSKEPDLDKILVDMLTTNLARHKALAVLSSQRLFDISRKLDKLDRPAIDRNIATEIADYAGVNTILMGSIIQIGQRIRINSQLVDVESGGIIGSEMVEGDRIEDIFSMVDVLTAKLSAELGVTDSEAEGRILRVAEVTTTSFEAYKQYQKGREKAWRREFDAAIDHYQNAIAIDSTFALAYLYLARAQNNTVDPLLDLTPVQEILQKAEAYSAGASEKERLLIRAYKAFYSRDFPRAYALFRTFEDQYPQSIETWTHVATRYLGKPEEALQRLQRQSEVDPAFPVVYNEQAYCYSQMGDHANAISAVKKYMALVPDIANAYDSAWDIYIQAGQLDEAMKICRAALAQNPNWAEFHILSGFTQLFMGEGDPGRKTMRQALALDPGQAAWFTKYIAFSYLYEGRYREAAAELEKAAGLAVNAAQNIEALRTYLELAKLHALRGNFPAAEQSIVRARAFIPKAYRHPVNPGLILAEYIDGRINILAGDATAARANAEKIRDLVTQSQYDIYFIYYHHLLRAELDVMAGKGAAALAELEKAPSMVHYFPRHHILRVESHALNGNLDRAIETCLHFRDLIDTELYYMGGDAFDYYYERGIIDYRLGKLYERRGDPQQAAARYAQFIAQWKHADANLPELADAKARLARVKR